MGRKRQEKQRSEPQSHGASENSRNIRRMEEWEKKKKKTEFRRQENGKGRGQMTEDGGINDRDVLNIINWESICHKRRH